jgi:hypothetical protein
MRFLYKKKIVSGNADQNFLTFNAMARLRNAPKNTLLRNLPDQDKIKLAIQWLCDNPDELPSTAARIYKIQKEDSVRKA